MSMLAVALEYLRSGLTIIPIKLDGSKSPALNKWRQLHEQPPSEAAVTAMFRDRAVGLAVLAGKTSGNLTIIDFDRPGAFEAWRELLEGMHPGMLEHLPVVQTPGGHHVYLRAATCDGNTKLARAAEKFQKTDYQGGFTLSDTIIETRGQGGYVVAPPSPPEAHLSGQPYVHVSGPALTHIPIISDDWYDALMNAARAFNEQAKPAKEERQAAKPSKPGEGTKPGEDFDARSTWFEVLEPHGWEAIRTIGDKTYWRRPGKKDGGISATTGHCGTKLWVFSSNAAPFESERAYNKFSAYGLLNCGGDYATAARELRAKGYGEQRQPTRRQVPSEPTPDKWAELNAGLERINGEPTPPPPDDTPFPDEAPPDMQQPSPRLEPMTAILLEQLMDDDAAAVMRPGVFERVVAMRADRAEWVLIGDVLRQKKKKAAFDAEVKKHDAQQKRAAVHEGWRAKLLYRENKDGDLVLENVLSNLVSVLTHDDAWQGVLAFDDFTNQIVTRKPPPFQRRSKQWADEDALEIKSWIEQNHALRPTMALTCEAILVVAKRNLFNSLRDYIEGLEDHGGESAIDTWLIDCFGALDNPYTREIGRKWMISAVARAYEPGCKVDHVLILEGEQGLKKSRAIKQLCPVPAWFTDGLSELGSKSQAEEIEGKWIVELAELKGVGRELDQTKAFVTREAENYRPAYGRYSVHRPRSCVFAGTVNPENAGYLRDTTGNRRWWPITCKRKSPEITPELRDRLWAEAKTLYLNGEKWWIEDEAMIAAVEAEQESRAQQDPWHERIESFVIGKQETSMDEILADSLKLEPAKWDDKTMQRVGRVMQKIKWLRFRKRENDGKLRWRYGNPNYEPPLPGAPPSKGNGVHQGAMPWA